MERIYNILEQIKEKPGLYIGKKSVLALSHFISGYLHAIHDLTGEYVRFDFQTFTEYKTGISTPAKHWSDILAVGRTDSEAFDLFFEYLEEYKTLAQTPEFFDKMHEEISQKIFENT